VERTATKRLAEERADAQVTNSSWVTTMTSLLRRGSGAEPWRRHRLPPASISKPDNWNDVPQRETGFLVEATRISQDDKEDAGERFVEKRADVGAAGLERAEHGSSDDVDTPTTKLTNDLVRVWGKRAYPSQPRASIHVPSSPADGNARRLRNMSGDSVRIWG